ncbi:MAG: hypothetical protein ACFFFG_17755 [Candidatus Thorarchaeota archaeon]
MLDPRVYDCIQLACGNSEQLAGERSESFAGQVSPKIFYSGREGNAPAHRVQSQ